MKQSYITILALIMVLSSCNDNELFEKEMYKNVVALISSDYYNTFEEIVPLSSTSQETIAYIAASSGGTHAPGKDLVIGLEEDQSPLDLYNRSLFDIDEKLYAKFLPKDKYEIVDYKIQIKAGERTGRTMIKLRPEGLSPDSTYFIGLKATDISGVEINQKKNTILYQVLIKNDYATQGENVFYAMTGLANAMVTAGNKKLFPLTHNSVRMIAGTEAFQSNVDHINKTSIILEVGADNHVIIKPYKDIDVIQLDGDSKYPNIFKVEESFGRRYNVFLLSYQYTIKGVKRIMQEELRLEITS
ncbi:DUF4361 domain-containing protein [Bacteroides sp.]|uniref:BT_3044 domain-containing protein n=1 Tax=Bacteroides sp. TaxID=29523 RepID=UPI0026354946|nr:DUF4361 domain-containing protein [Bacteroides sp.]MDD3037444.1 DUF4361 domain-containing protein [Bacteroides sp.]